MAVINLIYSAATTTAIVDATGRTCNWTPCLRVCPATAGAESSSTRRLLFSHDTNFVAEKAANGRELLAITASADAGRDDGAKPSWSGTISVQLAIGEGPRLVDGELSSNLVPT